MAALIGLQAKISMAEAAVTVESNHSTATCQTVTVTCLEKFCELVCTTCHVSNGE